MPMPTASSTISPVMVIAGEELFLRQQHLLRIRQDVLGDEDPGMAQVRFDESSDMATVLDEVRTPSMFASRKLVIVDPADKLLKGGGGDDAGKGKGTLSNREMLENYLESPSDFATLVLVCESWLKTTRIHKQLDKLGAVLWCEPLRDYQVPQWLTRRVREAYNKNIEPQAAQRLADLIGPDLQRLDNELAKLDLYEPQAPAIKVSAVDALVGFQHEQQIWDLINALSTRDAATALKKVAELWSLDPKIEFTATGAIFSWLHSVMKARDLMDRRVPDGQISRDLKLWPQDRADKVLAMARAWGTGPGAAYWSRQLLDVDLANKSGLGEPRSNIEKFIVRICKA